MQDRLKELVVKTVNKFGLGWDSFHARNKEGDDFVVAPHNLLILVEPLVKKATVTYVTNGQELGTLELDEELYTLFTQGRHLTTIDKLLKELE